VTAPSTGWRQYATPEAQQAFADAQARLDNGDYTPAGAVLRKRDQALTGSYERMVLQPAHEEFLRQCDDDEFACRFLEPAEGARVEFEADGGVVFGAFRVDDPDRDGYLGRWYLYGDDEPWTWRNLVFRYEIDMGGLILLAPTTIDEGANL
jgi:hypothetical protein